MIKGFNNKEDLQKAIDAGRPLMVSSYMFEQFRYEPVMTLKHHHGRMWEVTYWDGQIKTEFVDRDRIYMDSNTEHEEDNERFSKELAEAMSEDVAVPQIRSITAEWQPEW